MTDQKHRRMIVVELNEAERYFLEKYVDSNQLPTFKRLLKEGKFLETGIRSWDPSLAKAWRHISPWIVWPSVYTGMSAEEHQIIGFGQDSSVLQDRCIWDRLNAQGVTTGVMGNLMSFPVRRNPFSLFYIPEALATTADCVPEKYQAIQDFFVYTARHYSENFVSMAFKATWKLFRAMLKGLPLKLAYEVLKQVPKEILEGPPWQRNRALLQAKLQMAVFELLYNRYQPQFATIHLNPIAYMQHRYWRAAEPEHFKDEVGELDRHYFRTVENRKDYELLFKDAILDSFVLADQFLAKLLPKMDKDTLLVVMSGLGQRKMDPVDEIHNPEIRLYNIEKLLSEADITNCEILPQMNPDITLNFNTVEEASLAVYKLSQLKVNAKTPLFHVEQVGKQLFLEGMLPRSVWEVGNAAWIENQESEKTGRLFDYVRESRVKDQSTAHHRDNGWILFYGNTAPLALETDKLDVTEVCPTLLEYFV